MNRLFCTFNYNKSILCPVSSFTQLLKIILILSFLFFSLNNINAKAIPIEQEEIKRIFFDLDWTLLYEIQNINELRDRTNIFEFEGHYFRLTDGAGDLLQAIINNHPDVRISFFSGGSEKRNKLALEFIRLPDGRTAADIAEYVFSRQHLTLVSRDKNLPFTQRYKKIVSHLVENFTPNNTILIDDTPDFTEHSNIETAKALTAVKAYGRITFFENRPLEFIADEKGHLPSSEEVWRLERNKTALMYGVISRAIYLEDRGQGSFSSIAKQLLINSETGDHYDITDIRLKSLFREGYTALNQFSKAKINLETTSPALFCRQLL